MGQHNSIHAAALKQGPAPDAQACGTAAAGKLTALRLGSGCRAVPCDTTNFWQTDSSSLLIDSLPFTPAPRTALVSSCRPDNRHTGGLVARYDTALSPFAAHIWNERTAVCYEHGTLFMDHAMHGLSRAGSQTHAARDRLQQLPSQQNQRQTHRNFQVCAKFKYSIK